MVEAHGEAVPDGAGRGGVEVDKGEKSRGKGGPRVGRKKAAQWFRGPV